MPVGSARISTLEQTDGDRRFMLALVSFVSAVYLIGLVYYATVRPIDGDEGFYSTAARLVWEGKTPYRDFFYQQAPLLPYLYSWIWGIHPQSLVSMRLLSATCGATAVFLWGLWCASLAERVSTKVALATFAAVVMNPYWVSWHVVVKTYAMANLLMTITTLCLYLAFRSGRAWWCLGAGFALGTCISLRSLYAPLFPFVVLWLFFTERRVLPSSRKALAFLSGSLIGLLPMIVSFLRDPRAFYFNNIQYHRLDVGYVWLSSGRVVHGFQSFSHTALVYFATIPVRLIGMHPYFTIELVLAWVGWSSFGRLRHSEGQYTSPEHRYLQIDFLMFVVYTLTLLAHFPPHDQYFDSPLTPFLIPFVAEGLRRTLSTAKRRVVALTLAAPILLFTEVGRDASQTSWGPYWQLSSYRRVAEVIAANSHPDEVVLSFYPGFLFESGRQYFPGMENQFSYRIANKISSEENARYHIISYEQLKRAVTHRDIRLLVIHPSIMEYNEGLAPDKVEEFQNAVDANYSVISSIDGVTVCRRRPAE